MREHGVSISTPNGPAQLHATGTNPRVMAAAQKVCQRYRPQGSSERVTPAERVAYEDAVRNFVRCMRSRGLELQIEPHGGGRVDIRRTASRDGPVFQAAQKACEGPLAKAKRRPAGPVVVP